MSREYVVIIVPEPKHDEDIDGSSAEIFMRFTERPNEGFMQRISAQYRGKRVYCLMGASMWWHKP